MKAWRLGFGRGLEVRRSQLICALLFLSFLLLSRLRSGFSNKLFAVDCNHGTGEEVQGRSSAWLGSVIPGEVIEDMSIQVNVPALAMEEVAPLPVSDVAMLAPEEIFHGKGNIKEEAELTKEERKRRRANQ
ncbi:hypothetical protein ZIOFF_070733 [Zingiber officinale]|uniref:Uncharacterized protein n=1 Tax=Zingiber officinale TaxID=94328 RepID=A0A8J5EB20_ZINOF|nr:hypothetical protein ZIOFF_070733 [Zingiber officinale]